MSGQRAEQVSSTVRRLVQDALSRGLNDPRVRGLVSIVSVTVTDDLSEATIGVSVLPERHSALTLQGLRHATGHLQRRLAEGAALRRVPRLRFVLDDSMRRAAATEAALRGIAAHETDPREHHGT